MNLRKLPEKDLPDNERIDPYLWDGTGEPNAEVQRLEKTLFKLRHSATPPTFSFSDFAEKQSGLGLFHLVWPRRFAALAAAFAIAILGSVLTLKNGSLTMSRPGWEVAQVDGAPMIGQRSMQGSGAKGKLEVGQVLVTNENSRANITVAEIGEIQVDPSSRVRLMQASRDRKHIFLEEGTIHAAIWAPPGEFVVDTPSAVAVDLGCMYTLHVEPDGSGLLRTTLGWVGFHSNGRDSFIPAGAVCPTRHKVGPGTPYFSDASEPFQNALAQLDFGSLTPEARAAALQTILSQARKEDALSLWHLLSRTEGFEREQVYARFAAIVPPPQGVTRDGIVHLDQKQLDFWWNALDLGDISIWRFWEQTGQPGKPQGDKEQILMKKKELLKQSR
jgi:FecR protein